MRFTNQPVCLLEGQGSALFSFQARMGRSFFLLRCETVRLSITNEAKKFSGHSVEFVSP